VLVLQIEADGLLEVNLNRAALVFSLERIVHLNVDLGSVESAIAVVVCPWLSNTVESILQRSLGLVPLSL
jgi:hypothetical protein